MTKIKLTDGTIINASDVEVVNGTLKITTEEHTVEELATLFRDKDKTSHIVLLTESEKESGFKDGFTSFAGIYFNEDGTKTIELFQPKDVTEARLSTVEGNTVKLSEDTSENTENIISVQAQVDYLAMMSDVEMEV